MVFSALKYRVGRFVRNKRAEMMPRKPVKVFCLGLNRTATTSIGRALDQLGYRTWHWTPKSADFVVRWNEGRFTEEMETAVRTFDAFEDLPWPLLYRELFPRYPNAKYILTLRESPEVWLKSIQKHIATREAWVGDYLVYGSHNPVLDAQMYLDTYNRHRDDVEAYFKRNNVELLRFCPEAGDGWKELAGFLGITSYPSGPFPHANPFGSKPIKVWRDLSGNEVFD